MRINLGRYLLRFYDDASEQDRQRAFYILKSRGGFLEAKITPHDLQVIANREMAAILMQLAFVKSMAPFVEKSRGRVLRLDPEIVVETDDQTTSALRKLEFVLDVRRATNGFY